MISLAICTYNRVGQLKVLLDGLQVAQQWLHRHAEVIVVDNNSSDSTGSLVAGYAESLPIRLVSEAQQGLANARNRALQEYNGEAILFLDDDVSIDQAALEYYRLALENRPECQYFGGRIVVEWNPSKPNWLKSNDLVLLQGLFGEYNLGDVDLDYETNSLGPFGANFMLRRSLVENVGAFNPHLGVKGDELGRGEETDFFQRAREQNYLGVYLAKAVVGHRFQQQRISISYLYRYGVEKGRAAARFEHGYTLTWRTTTLKYAFKGLLQLIKLRRDRFYQCVINAGIARGVAQATADKSIEKNKPTVV